MFRAEKTTLLTVFYNYFLMSTLLKVMYELLSMKQFMTEHNASSVIFLSLLL